MDNFGLYLLIFCVVYVFFLIKFFLGAQKPTSSTVECYVGGLGTGKTFLAVKRGLAIYRRTLLRYKIYKFFNKKTKLEVPQLISNIPIKLDKNNWSTKLKAGHILGTVKIPENSVLILDEIGNIFSQTSYNTFFHTEFLTPFIRLFRHWTDGKLIVTDQSSGSINIEIRRRLNVIYNLSKLSTKLFGKVYKINFFETVVSDDLQSVVSSNDLNKNYFAGFFGFRRYYESRTFKKTYKAVDLLASDDKFNNFYADYLIDFSNAYTIDKKLSYSAQLATVKSQLDSGLYDKSIQ